MFHLLNIIENCLEQYFESKIPLLETVASKFVLKGFFFSWNFDWEMSLISPPTLSLCVFMFYMYHRFNVQQVQYLRSMEKLRVGFEWKETLNVFYLTGWKIWKIDENFVLIYEP